MFKRDVKVKPGKRRAVAGRSVGKKGDSSGMLVIDDNRDALPAVFNGRVEPLQLQQVDTSSSPFLPDYDEDETPAWKQERGVPQWARDQYCEEARRTLIASVTKGKIGSVYFTEGRIRTTHFEGPEEESHAGTQRYQFNIDIKQAESEFVALHPTIDRDIKAGIDRSLPPEQKRELLSKRYYYACDGWIARRLNSSPVDSLPAWATRVTGPESAIDLDRETPSSDTVLFEIFVAVSGEVDTWHPSRGVAAKFATNKQVISVLKAALKKLDEDNITDYAARNIAFYNFIKSRLPDFVANIRAPNEI